MSLKLLNFVIISFNMFETSFSFFIALNSSKLIRAKTVSIISLALFLYIEHKPIIIKIPLIILFSSLG